MGTSTRTTSPPSSTRTASASARGTTAPSRSCAASTSPPRRAPRSTCTTDSTTWTPWRNRSSRREPCLDTSPPEPKLSALYQELILDHYRRPRNKGTLEGATHSVSLNNPLCGDEIELQLRVDGDVIKEARFIGRGCSISQAAASMMTQLLKDRSIPQALALAVRISAMMQGDEAAARDRSLGDLRALAGVSKFPVRIKCALLPWNALTDAVR